MQLARNIVAGLWGIAAICWFSIYLFPGAGVYAVLFTVTALGASVLGAVYEVVQS